MTVQSSLELTGDTLLIELERVRPASVARVFAKWKGANPTTSNTRAQSQPTQVTSVDRQMDYCLLFWV